MLIDQVASPTIHREPCKWSSESDSWAGGFREIHHWITDGKDIIHIPSAIEIRLKELGKTGFNEQSFSDVDFGARRARSKNGCG